MGLAERRAVEQFKSGTYPELVKEVEAAAGFAVPIEVKWETLAVEGQAANIAEWAEKVYFQPLIAAFTAIAFDAMGKEALKGGVKKVIIDGADGSSASAFTFVDGDLVLLHRVDTNVDEVSDRAQGIQTLLESKL